MKIRVTQAHIDRGLRGIANRCPVALAITEQYGKPCHVSTLFGEVVFEAQGRARLTARASRFANAFDAKKPVKPFEFDLEVES